MVCVQNRTVINIVSVIAKLPVAPFLVLKELSI